VMFLGNMRVYVRIYLHNITNNECEIHCAYCEYLYIRSPSTYTERKSEKEKESVREGKRERECVCVCVCVYVCVCV